jgi:hypothetical protein
MAPTTDEHIQYARQKFKSTGPFNSREDMLSTRTDEAKNLRLSCGQPNPDLDRTEELSEVVEGKEGTIIRVRLKLIIVITVRHRTHELYTQEEDYIFDENDDTERINAMTKLLGQFREKIKEAGTTSKPYVAK